MSQENSPMALEKAFRGEQKGWGSPTYVNKALN